MWPAGDSRVPARQDRTSSDLRGEEGGGSNSSMAGKQVRVGPTIPSVPAILPAVPMDASKANSCSLQDARSPASQAWPPLGWPRTQHAHLNCQEASRDSTGKEAAPSSDEGSEQTPLPTGAPSAGWPGQAASTQGASLLLSEQQLAGSAPVGGRTPLNTGYPKAGTETGRHSPHVWGDGLPCASSGWGPTGLGGGWCSPAARGRPRATLAVLSSLGGAFLSHL